MLVLPKFKDPAASVDDFESTLKRRVKTWLDANGVSKQGSWAMLPKALFFLSLSAAIYLTLLLGHLPLWLEYVTWGALGIAMALIAMNVGHDAIHGSFSSSDRVNRLFSWTFELMGINVRNWQIEHNLRHHGYTNIPSVDLNVEFPEPAGRIIRLHPRMPWYPIHRWQHFYVLLLYGSLTLSMQYVNDLRGALLPHPKTGRYATWGEHLQHVIGKIFHITMMIVVPLYTLGRPAYQVLLGYLALHVCCSSTLATLFQIAHLTAEVEVVYVDAGQGRVPRSWMEHQARTSMNFRAGNSVLDWALGGLNYQIEHHLFPGTCHQHYPGLSAVIAETCREFGVPYVSKSSFREAAVVHFRHLRNLGRAPAPALQPDSSPGSGPLHA